MRDLLVLNDLKQKVQIFDEFVLMALPLRDILFGDFLFHYYILYISSLEKHDRTYYKKSRQNRESKLNAGNIEASFKLFQDHCCEDESFKDFKRESGEVDFSVEHHPQSGNSFPNHIDSNRNGYKVIRY
jgi:hypothetical protein